LKAFLLAVLDLPEEEYGVLEIMDTHLRVDYPDEKLGILDVHIKTKAGKHVDLEIQVARTPFLRERITAYTGKTLGIQLSAGEAYAEMKKVITIVILDYNLIEENGNFHNKYLLYDAKTKSLFTDIMEIHTLEMRKLPTNLEDMPETDEKTKRQLWWLKFIRTGDEEEIRMLAAKVPEIQDAYGVLRKLSENERVRLLYESREKAIIDEQARLYVASKEGLAKGLEKGRAEGLKKGRAEGIEEAKLEVAQNLLTAGMPPDAVAKAVKLPLKRIQKLIQ
jgi:predicted transposase/invertase (TIGR01784 family)